MSVLVGTDFKGNRYTLNLWLNFYMGDNFSNALFAFMYTKSVWKRGPNALKVKNRLPRMYILSFFIRHSVREAKTIKGVAFPTSVFFPCEGKKIVPRAST